MKDTMEIRIHGRMVILEEGDTILQHGFAVEEEAQELYRKISAKVRRMVGGVK
jgi:hypothetical protein